MQTQAATQRTATGQRAATRKEALPPMSDDQRRDDWDGFNWSTWGESPSGNHNGASPKPSDFIEPSDEYRASDDDRPDGESEPAAPGTWVSLGGVMHWEGDEPAQANPQTEAASQWADDSLDLPPGVPDAARVRAAHAWILRQRALESEAIGQLLLARRELQSGGDEQATETGSPLDLELAEHQAAVEEYERLVTALDDITAHNGPAHVMVEFYLTLTERLAELAAAPEAPADFAERLLLVPVEDEEAATGAKTLPTPQAEAQWRGRSEAVIQARRRVERVTSPEPED